MTQKKSEAAKTRLNNFQRKTITKAFTAAFAVKQVNMSVITAVTNDFIVAVYDFFYDTQGKRSAIKLLIDENLYPTSIQTRVNSLVAKTSELNVDTGYEEFDSIQRAYGLEYGSDRTLPLSNYSDFKVIQHPHDLIERAMVDGSEEVAKIIADLKNTLTTYLKIDPVAMGTYSAVCGMIKAARTAEDLIDLLPEIAPVVIKVVGLKPASSIVVAPTLEMREVLAKLTPIEMKDAE